MKAWRVGTAALVLAVALAALVAVAPTAGAYGSTAIYQIGISDNCNNPAYCSDLGGFWGWAEFDQGGLGDATFAGCDHVLGGPAGAQGLKFDIAGWTIAPGRAGAQTFWVISGTETLTGHTGGAPVTFPITQPMDTGISAVPGHYSTAQVLGFQAPPGVAIQIQVTQIPHR